MNRRTLLLLVAATLLPPGLVALRADEDISPVSGPTEAAVASTPPGWSRPGSSVLHNPRGTQELGRGHATEGAPIDRLSQASPVRDDGNPRLSLSAPAFIDRGSVHELAIGIRMPRGAQRVEFTLSANPELIELGVALRGRGSPRGETGFEVSVDEVANRIAIDVERADGWPQDETVNLAVVRFEGAGPGSATITASEIIARDAAGDAVYVSPTPETAQLVVMSGPI